MFKVLFTILGKLKYFKMELKDINSVKQIFISWPLGMMNHFEDAKMDKMDKTLVSKIVELCGKPQTIQQLDTVSCHKLKEGQYTFRAQMVISIR